MVKVSVELGWSFRVEAEIEDSTLLAAAAGSRCVALAGLLVAIAFVIGESAPTHVLFCH